MGSSLYKIIKRGVQLLQNVAPLPLRTLLKKSRPSIRRCSIAMQLPKYPGKTERILYCMKFLNKSRVRNFQDDAKISQTTVKIMRKNTIIPRNICGVTDALRLCRNLSMVEFSALFWTLSAKFWALLNIFPSRPSRISGCKMTSAVRSVD